MGIILCQFQEYSLEYLELLGNFPINVELRYCEGFAPLSFWSCFERFGCLKIFRKYSWILVKFYCLRNYLEISTIFSWKWNQNHSYTQNQFFNIYKSECNFVRYCSWLTQSTKIDKKKKRMKKDSKTAALRKLKKTIYNCAFFMGISTLSHHRISIPLHYPLSQYKYCFTANTLYSSMNIRVCIRV